MIIEPYFYYWIDPYLWVGAILFYGVGDAISTVLAVSQKNIVERGWIARRLYGEEPSLRDLYRFKIALFLIAYIAYIGLSGVGVELVFVIPLSLTIGGLVVTAINLYHYRKHPP